MIDLRELRIGNLLNKDGIVVTIDAKSIFDIWDNSDKYKPLPLTEEWLIKFGFEKIEDIRYEKKIRITGLEPDDPNAYKLAAIGSRKIKVAFLSFGKWSSTGVEYVHQFQNLYYAIAGEELQYERRPRHTCSDI